MAVFELAFQIFLSVPKAFSIGLKSGEYGGSSKKKCPAFFKASKISAF